MILVENAKPVDFFRDRIGKGELPLPTVEPVSNEPTEFRKQHGKVRRAVDDLPAEKTIDKHGKIVEGSRPQIIDSQGNIGDPWRGLTLLDDWERSGRISKEMHDAGDEFHRLFYRAHLEPLKAADMGRVGGAGGLVEYSGDPKARDRFNAALEFLGGSESMLGSCAWSVIGENHSIRHWAGCWGGWPMDQKEAAGVVKGALGALKVHFGY